jgi:excisionase family DNA binding protein
MSTLEPQMMTVQEVADYLRLNQMTIYKLAQKGKIPAVKVGRVWRFRKDLIDEWFREKASDPLKDNQAVDSGTE